MALSRGRDEDWRGAVVLGPDAIRMSARPLRSNRPPAKLNLCRCVAPGCGKSPAYVTGIALDIILLFQLAGVKSSHGTVNTDLWKTSYSGAPWFGWYPNLTSAAFRAAFASFMSR